MRKTASPTPAPDEVKPVVILLRVTPQKARKLDKWCVKFGIKSRPKAVAVFLEEALSQFSAQQRRAPAASAASLRKASAAKKKKPGRRRKRKTSLQPIET